MTKNTPLGEIDEELQQFAHDVYELGIAAGEGKFSKAVLNPWVKFMPTEDIKSLMLSILVDSVGELETPTTKPKLNVELLARNELRQSAIDKLSLILGLK